MTGRRTIFHGLVEAVWYYLALDQDFRDSFPLASRKDYTDIWRQPLDVTGSDCPLVAIRLVSVAEDWATNLEKDFDVELAADVWLATDDQASILDAYAVLRRPLDDQLVNRFGLTYAIDFGLKGAAQFRTVKEMQQQEGQLVQVGVLESVSLPFQFTLRRDPRNAGLYL